MAVSPNESIVNRSLRNLSQSASILQHGRRWWLLGTAIAVVMVLVAALLTHFVGMETRNVVLNQLVAARESNTESLKLWLSLQERIVANATNTPDVQEFLATTSRQIAEQEFSYLKQSDSPDFRDVVAAIEMRLPMANSLAWVLQNDAGFVVASSEMMLGGRTDFPIPQATQNRVLSGRATVSPAFRSPIPLGKFRPGTPISVTIAPVRNHDDTVIGMLSMIFDPAGEFSRVLAVARSGNSGETYAVDREGRMISRSRFDDQLRQLGLLPNDEEISSIIEIKVCDPGVDLTLGKRPTSRKLELPLSLMAKDLLRGGAGSNGTGYRDYRGVKVIGAWRWIDGYDFGVATEIDIVEAMRPLVVLQRLLWTLSGIALAALIGVAALAYITARYQKSAEESSRIAHRMGQYVLLAPIGAGGMGNVYRGRHSLLRRPVAIKVLRTGLEQDPRARQRFEREVQLTSQLTSPHTVAIYDYGCTSKNEFFYVMEYFDGIDLAKLIEQFGPISAARTIHLLRQLCESLAEAHQAGVVHRDVKPANILLTARGCTYDFLKLVDFGLGKYEDVKSVFLTRTGAMAGTPMYMSPEAVNDAGKVTNLSDLYSLGAVAYWLIAGTPLFEMGTPMEVCMRQVGQQPIPPSALGRDVPNDLENLILRCLAKNPADRPQSAEEVIVELNRCRDAQGWTPDDAKQWWFNVYIPNQQQDTMIKPFEEDTFESARERFGTSVELDASRIE